MHPSSVDFAANAQANINMIFAQTFQQIKGFGAAFTEASAYNFFKLPAAIQDKVLEAYFGQSGLKYNIGRVPINSCDFSLDSYNFDPVAEDFNLDHFDSLLTHDTRYIIPFIKRSQMVAGGKLKFFGSPWSPPAWMKVPFDKSSPVIVNGTTEWITQHGVQTMTGSSEPFGLRNDSRVQYAWAKYISKWLSAYQNYGIDFWAVTVQNEPEFPAPWEACAYSSSYMADFVKRFLGPVLKKDHPELEILGFDHNKDHVFTWAQALYNDPDVAQYLSGLAFHWYGGGMDRLVDGTYGYYNLDRTNQKFPNKYLFASEACSCPNVELGSWIRAERKAHDIIQDLNHFATGWTDWNLLLDYQGGPNHVGNLCDAPVICNQDYSDVTLQPEYFYQGHIFRYVQPGAKRVYSNVQGHYLNNGGDSGAFLGMDVTLYNNERSTRQIWKLTDEGKIALWDTLAWEYPQCIGGPTSFNQEALKLTNCFFGGGGHPENWGGAKFMLDGMDRFLLLSGSIWQAEGYDPSQEYCLGIMDGSENDAAALTLSPCANLDKDGSPPLFQRWTVDPQTGFISSKLNGKCMTAGWAFFQGGAFINPDGSRIVVVLNEATEDVTFNMVDGPSVLTTSIPAKSIQTYVF